MENNEKNEHGSVQIIEMRSVSFSDFEKINSKPIKTVSDLFGSEPKYLTLDYLLPLLEKQKEQGIEDKLHYLLVSQGKKNILSSVEILRSVYNEYNINIALVKMLQEELRKPSGSYIGGLEKNVANIVCPMFSIGPHPTRVNLEATICMSCDYSPIKNNGNFCKSPRHEIAERFMLKTSPSYIGAGD